MSRLLFLHLRQVMACLAMVFSVSLPQWACGAKPVGVVMLVEGNVTLQHEGGKEPLKCAMYNQVYEGTKVSVGETGSIAIVFSRDRHIEKVTTSGIRTATTSGLTPQSGVATNTLDSRKSLAVRSSVSSLPGSSLQGMVILRGVEREDEVRPVNRALVNGADLTFSWPEHPQATSYIITIRSESREHPTRPTDNHIVFRGRAKSHNAALTGRMDFEPGVMYFWNVDAERNDGTEEKDHASGQFMAASPAQTAIIQECQEMLRSDDEAQLSLAALTLYKIGAKDHAITAYRMLSTEVPQNPLIRVALGTLYQEVQWYSLGEREYEAAVDLGYDESYMQAARVDQQLTPSSYPSRDLNVFLNDAVRMLESSDSWEEFLREFVSPESRTKIDRRMEYSLLQALRTIQGTTPDQEEPDTGISTFECHSAIGGLERISVAKNADDGRLFLKF